MRRLAALVTAMVLAPQGHACDAARGAAVFAKCAICHSRSAGEPSPVGPHLGGLAGRPAASVPGFHYSRALRTSGLVWNSATLEQFLRDPQAAVPGTAMAFAGLADATERAAVACLLTSNPPSSQP